MKNYLAIDTSGDYLTVVARKGEKTFVTFEENCAMRHSERLMSAVGETLSRAGLTPEGCGFFCAVTGPGSFTGIRIGISAAKGFCAAVGKPALGITSFAVAAYNAEEKAVTAIPAGRGYWYVCGFEPDKSIFLPAARVTEEELASLASQYPVYSFSPLPVPYKKADPASGLVRAVAAAGEEDFGELSAFYLKKSQAEEELEDRQRQHAGGCHGTAKMEV